MVKAKQQDTRSKSAPQKMRTYIQAGARRRGQTLMEMALVVPILLLLVLGIIQYGIINNAAVTLTQLSREGGRYAAVHANDTGPDIYTNPVVNDDPDSKIKNHIKQVAAATSIDYNDIKNSITITPAIGSRSQGGDITVAFSYPLVKKMFLVPASFPGLSGLQSYSVSCTMVIEQ